MISLFKSLVGGPGKGHAQPFKFESSAVFSVPHLISASIEFNDGTRNHICVANENYRLRLPIRNLMRKRNVEMSPWIQVAVVCTWRGQTELTPLYVKIV